MSCRIAAESKSSIKLHAPASTNLSANRIMLLSLDTKSVGSIPYGWLARSWGPSIGGAFDPDAPAIEPPHATAVCSTSDADDEVRSVTVPTLLVIGDRDFVRLDHAAEMLPYTTFVGEFRVHYAGFFDPGFGHSAAGGTGSHAVLEVRSHEVPFVLEHGQTGLSTAFDMPTLMGYDSDHPRSLGEVGREGVAVDSLDDMETLFSGIPLGEVSTSMTINAPAAMLLAFYACVGEKQGVPIAALRGTVQTDILKEYIAQKEYIYPPAPSMRLVVDTFEFGSKFVPRWNTISISGYHIREAGSTALQELAFTLYDGVEYVEWAPRRGLEVDEFGPDRVHVLAVEGALGQLGQPDAGFEAEVFGRNEADGHEHALGISRPRLDRQG